MSNFTCEHCGTILIDSPNGYVTECEHYPKTQNCECQEIPEWEGYKICSDGTVYSCRFGFNQTRKLSDNWKPLKPQIIQGYYYVNLRNNKKRWMTKVHRLLAQAFIANPENKPLVLHKDGNRLNNSLDNLYWGTHKENLEDAKRHETWWSKFPKGQIPNCHAAVREDIKLECHCGHILYQEMIDRGLLKQCLCGREFKQYTFIDIRRNKEEPERTLIGEESKDWEESMIRSFGSSDDKKNKRIVIYMRNLIADAQEAQSIKIYEDLKKMKYEEATDQFVVEWDEIKKYFNS